MGGSCSKSDSAECTKPSTEAYWRHRYHTDRCNGEWGTSELEQNTREIEADVNEIIAMLKTGNFSTVVLPGEGLGTGVAKLARKAPETHKVLKEQMYRLTRYPFHEPPAWQSLLWYINKWVQFVQEPSFTMHNAIPLKARLNHFVNT